MEKLCDMFKIPTRELEGLIVENTPDLIFVKDTDFRIVHANEAFLKAYPEHLRDSIIGTTTVEEYPREEAEEFLKNDRLAFKEGSSETEETIKFPDGVVRVLNTRKVRFENEHGERFILGVARDITARKETEIALKESQERYEAAIRGASVGLWDWNVKTGELFWSEQLREIIGIEDDSFQPQFDDFSERLHPEDKQSVLDAIAAHLKDNTPYNINYRLRRTDDSYIWIHARGQALWDNNGNPVRMAGSVNDISESREKEEQRQEMIEKLANANKELEKFAYIASHDLQEPLRMITRFTELLSELHADKLDEQGQEFLRFAFDGAKRMQVLIDDLLEYTRLSADSEPIELVDTGKAVQVARYIYLDNVERLNAKIIVKNLPHLYVSRVRFIRLLQNLIGNSLKYSNPDKLAEIRISSKEEAAAWVFCVEDNGIGMQQKYCERIFEPFKRLHGNHQYSGSGIGLAICKKIVESFGGKIWAESKPGKGSKFYFTVPKINSQESEVAQ